MEALIFICLGALGIVVAWYVLKVIVGVSLPLDMFARSYLGQCLKERGLTAIVPLACLDECAAKGPGHAQTMSKFSGKHVRDALAEQLEHTGLMLGLWIHGDDSFQGRDKLYYRRDKLYYKEIFERHGVPRLGR